MATSIPQPPIAGHPTTGIAEQAWIAAVHTEVVALKSTLYAGARLGDAEGLICAGAVTRTAEGLWQVESRTTPGVFWQVDGSCDCPDAEHTAPDGLCAHRLAVGITKRALKAVQACRSLAPEMAGTEPEEVRGLPLARSAGDVAEPSAPAPETGASSMPEAAFSITLKGTLGGHDALLTARGQTWEAFQANVERLKGMLDAPPTPPASAPGVASAPPSEMPTCPTHGPMKPSTKTPGSYYCTKKLYDGSYCQSRHP